MLRYMVALLSLFSLSSQNVNKEEIKTYEAGEVYSVYSAVVALEKTKGDLLIGDTTVPFSNCLERNSDKRANAAIEDYKKVNKPRWRLGYHFEMNRPYKLLSAKEADEFLQPDKRTGEWRLTPESGIHHFSAVGFSVDRTIAFLEMDLACGGLCGHGRPYLLQKKNGRWTEYNPAPAKNADGTYIFGSFCSWNY
jgi:hypothetical protein